MNTDLPKQRTLQPDGTGKRWTTRLRLFLLLACLAVGLVIGFIGMWITSSSAWFLAVPTCVAIAWLFVADPTQCVAPSRGEH